MIPVCEPFLAGNEERYVMDALRSGWISSAGKYISEFEASFSSYCGVKHGIAVCNGTAALHLALRSLGIDSGDEVIIPDFTMIASAFAVCYCRAIPVFVDAEADTWNIDTAKIEEKISPRTRAIMAVHIYGHPCDMEPVKKLAEKYQLKIVEDAAEVHGAEYKGKKCGSLGDISAFSFYANKNITTGEGGMVVTDDDELAQRCRYLKNLCFPLKGYREFIHNDIGFNYRMSNLHAAIGFAQTEKADFYRGLRRNHARLYQKYLRDVPGLIFQPEKQWAVNVYWMNAVLVTDEFPLTRDGLMEELRKSGIDSRPFFMPMHRQPALKKYGCDCSGSYPVSVNLSKNGLYLPSGSGLTDEDIQFICNEIKKMC